MATQVVRGFLKGGPQWAIGQPSPAQSGGGQWSFGVSDGLEPAPHAGVGGKAPVTAASREKGLA